MSYFYGYIDPKWKKLMDLDQQIKEALAKIDVHLYLPGKKIGKVAEFAVDGPELKFVIERTTKHLSIMFESSSEQYSAGKTTLTFLRTRSREFLREKGWEDFWYNGFREHPLNDELIPDIIKYVEVIKTIRPFESRATIIAELDKLAPEYCHKPYLLKGADYYAAVTADPMAYVLEPDELSNIPWQIRDKAEILSNVALKFISGAIIDDGDIDTSK